MRNLNLIFTLVFIAFIKPSESNANEIKKYKPNLSHNRNSSELSTAFTGMENQFVASTLRDGIKSLNDSVKTLMDSIFYSLMDRKLTLSLNSNFAFSANYDREVHETALGSYVVIDQFHIGPELYKNLAQLGATPLDLTTNGGFTVTNITHQTEANRAIDQNDSTLFEATIKNWFGLLPVLDKILPVSFNPLELYNPIQYLKTPFLFPFKVEQIKDMAIGTIRSITLSGGLTVSIDALLPEQDYLKNLIKIDNLTSIFPYGITKNGSHRINVMRKNRDIVWLAITDSNEFGQQLTLDLSNNYFAFSRLIPGYQGIKIPLSPIKQFYADLKVKTYDQIYEFDLKVPEAKIAYEKAVRGHLVLADRLSRKKRKNSGVAKKFTRKILADEFRDFGAHSAYIINHKSHSTIKSGLSKINIKNKVNYIMFAKSGIGSEVWDLAAGKDSYKLNTNFEVKVKKKDSKKEDIDNFELAPTDRNPFQLMTNFNILNKTANTVDFNRTIKTLDYYTGLDFKNLPKFAKNTKQEIQKHKSEVALVSPEDRLKAKFLQPHRLGHFQLNASVSFPYKSLINIKKVPTKNIERSIQRAFETYYQGSQFDPKPNIFKTMSSYVLSSLRIFELQFPTLDFTREVESLKRSITNLARSNEPQVLIKTFADLFDTPYTLQVIHALRYLVKTQGGDIATKVHITTRPTGNAKDPQSMRYRFHSLNGFTQHTGEKQINSFTNNLIDKYIERFTSNTLGSSIPTPILKGITFNVHTSKNKQKSLTSDISFTPVDNYQGDIFCYLRLEEAGIVDISRFKLGDKLVKLPMKQLGLQSNKNPIVNFKLSGQGGLFTTIAINQAFMEEKSYDLYISLSDDKSNWSRPVFLKLQFHRDGRITFP